MGFDVNWQSDHLISAMPDDSACEGEKKREKERKRTSRKGERMARLRDRHETCTKLSLERRRSVLKVLHQSRCKGFGFAWVTCEPPLRLRLTLCLCTAISAIPTISGSECRKLSSLFYYRLGSRSEACQICLNRPCAGNLIQGVRLARTGIRARKWPRIQGLENPHPDLGS